MAKKTREKKRITLDDAKEKLAQAIGLTKLFSGFKTPQGITDSIEAAVNAVRRGNEKEAVSTLLEAENGVRCILSAFFRGSPKFFAKKREELEELCANRDHDILERVNKQDKALEEYARSQSEMDLTEAACVYNKTIEMYQWARKEQEERHRKRGERERKQQEEDLRKQIEAQQELEQERRNERATEIAALANLIAS